MTAQVDNRLAPEKDGKLVEMIVKAATTVYQNSIVIIEDASGHIKPAVAEASARLAGIAYEDNKLGETVIRVQRQGSFPLVGTGFAITDMLKPVFASDDQTVSTTQASNEVEIGVIVEVLSSTSVMVDLKRY